MKFKHDEDRRDWSQPPITRYDKRAFARLKEFVSFLDAFCVLCGWGSVTITSLYRPRDLDSYHSLLQAADLRSQDKPPMFRWAMVLMSAVLRMVDPHLQIYVHRELWGKLQEHIHIAIKDGKL